ncbi:MAG: nitric oxide reductase activation protein NorD [Sandaracinaceae bacterium]
MSFDERLFSWFYRRIRGGSSRPPPRESVAVRLHDLEPRLALLGSALAGRAIALRPAEDVGGVRGATWSLPAYLDAWPTPADNVLAYVYRVAYGAASSALGVSVAASGVLPAASRVVALLVAPATRRHLEAQLPRTRELFEALVGPVLATMPEPASPAESEAWALARLALGAPAGGAAPSGRLREAFSSWPCPDPAAAAALAEARRDELDPLERALSTRYRAPLLLLGRLFAPEVTATDGEAATPGRGTPPDAGSTEIAAPPREEVERVDVGASQENESPLVHSLERVHTLDDYRGGAKRHDGEDQLEEQLAALDELDLRQVVRTSEQARSVLRLDGLFEGFSGEVADGEGPDRARRFERYDEWDARRRAYRRGWCTLYLEASPPASSREAAAGRVRAIRRAYTRQLRDLRATFEALELERRWRNRQLDGTDLDVDALVDRSACLAAGRTPDERLYATRLRHERDVATLMLLDVSLSSDSWIDGRRVLNVAQDAMIMLGEVLHGVRDAFAVAGFQSFTRRDCRWLPLKAFADPWPLATRRLLAVEPAGYTRIGPALRHGIRVLSAHPARRRLLLLITDAKPTDYDRYEGRYGIDDVRQAFREAEQEEVHPFAISVVDAGASRLPRMFGAGRYEVLRSPHALPGAVAGVYARLAR